MNSPPAATCSRPPTFCWSARLGQTRHTWRWGWPAPPPTPATGPTSPPPPIWLPAATARRSRAAGPPPCGSTPDRPCWPSDELAVHPGGGVDIEALQRGGGGQAGEAQPAGQPACLGGVDLDGQQPLQRHGQRQLLGGGLVEHGWEGFGG